VRKHNILKGDGHEAGAGLLAVRSPMTIRNVNFSNNQAGRGGAIYNMNQSEFPPKPETDQLKIMNSTFENNTATKRGGAIVNDLASATLISDSVFKGNTSEDKGGAIFNDFAASPVILNSKFENNTARTGAVMLSDGGSSPVIKNSTIVNNHATDEGVIYQGTGEGSTLTLLNSVVENNKADAGDVIYTFHDDKTNIIDSQIQGEKPVQYTNGYNPNALGYNANQSPISVDALKSQSRQLGDAYIPKRQPNPNVNLNDTNLAGGKADRPKPGNIKQSDRIIYVNNQTDIKNPNGSSWGSAYTDLDAALKDAARDGAQVWVAEGNYLPQGEGRNSTFKLGDGVRMYGGFKGSETSLSQADPSKNTTILNGDLGEKGNATDNAYHVVTGGQKASLNGFTVTNGYANGEAYNSHGGGMINYDKDKPQGRPDLELGYHVNVPNTVFKDNYAKTGGAVYNYGNSDVTFKNNAFVNNKADNGGAVMDVAGVHGTYTNNIFFKNSAKYNGGAVNEDYGSQSTFTNNKYIANNATDGGALYGNSRASQIGQTNMIVDQNTFALNMATRNGGAVNADYQSIAQLRNNQDLLNLDPRLLSFRSTVDGKLQTYDPTKATTTPPMGGQQPPMGGRPPMSGPPLPFGMPPRSMAV